MRVGGYFDYASAGNYMRNIKPIEEDGTVRTLSTASVSNSQEITDNNINVNSSQNRQDTESESENSESNRQEVLSLGKVYDLAINRDMISNKDLSGSKSSLENLDIQRAISTMQKDSVLREYQSFVKNPDNDNEDGTVRKIR